MKTIVSLLCLSVLFSYASAAPKLAVYWGQNSAGSTYPNDQTKWEKGLRAYCADTTYDIIILSFANMFPTAPGSTYPGLNFASHCETYLNAQNPFTLMCPTIGSDVEYCQSQGKAIFLSIGGAAGVYGFSSDAVAQTFAGTFWNMFMGGTSDVRPFGNVKIDGVDLDIEGGSTAGYGAFITKLREYYATDSSKQYYISGAPQCVYPDAYLGPTGTSALQTAHFDYVFVQFYNNYCGINNFGTSSWNFDTWANWASTISVNKNAKVFIGAPAAQSAAGSGYIPLSSLQNVISQTASQYPNVFGGVMLWEASLAELNNGFGASVASYLKTLPGSSGGSSGSGSSAGTTGQTPATTGARTSAPATTGSPTTAPATSAAGTTAPATTASTSSDSASGAVISGGGNSDAQAESQQGDSVSRMSNGAVAGLVIGVALGVLALTVLGAWIVRKREGRARSSSTESTGSNSDVPILQGLQKPQIGAIEMGTQVIARYTGDNQPYAATITKYGGEGRYFVQYGPKFNHEGEWLTSDRIRVWN
jgi:chitinase